MEALIDFFENVPTSFRTGILIGGIFLFWVMEGVIPLFQFQYRKYRHAGINLFFTLCTAIIGFGLAGVLYGVSIFVTENEFGLLYLVEMPLWLQVIIGVMLLDLIGAYFAHWTEHKIKWMWISTIPTAGRIKIWRRGRDNKKEYFFSLILKKPFQLILSAVNHL